MNKKYRGRMLLIAMAVSYVFFIDIAIAEDPYTTHVGGNVSGTWTTSPYATHYITGDIIIQDNQTLIIQPGVIVKFAAGVELTVYGTLDVNGTSGTNNDAIFTSRDDNSCGATITSSDGNPAAGDWDGIYVSASGGAYDGIANFDYCRIRFGGNTSGSSNANLYYYYDAVGEFKNSFCDYSAKYGIYINRCDAGAITIDNSVIQNSANHGLYSDPWSNQIVTNNTFTNNTGSAAYFYVAYMVTIAGNSGSGNGLNALEMDALSLQSNCTWSTSNTFPIVLKAQSTMAEGDTLTITAGSVLKGRSSGELQISGILDVNGSSGSPVIFTSFKDDNFGGNTDGVVASPAAGDWDGIYLYGSGTAQGIGHFSYANIFYGGASGGGVGANVFFYASDTGSISHSEFLYSGTYGVYMSYCSNGPIPIDYAHCEGSASHGLYSDGWSEHIITNTSFDNNRGYGGYLSGGILIQFISNAGEDNSINGMRLEGTQSMDGYWSSTGTFPIVFTDEVTIAEGKTITVAAGSIFKATTSGRLFVSGTLDVNGTSDSIVVFTSLKDDTYGGNTDSVVASSAAGDWKGIRLYGPGTYQGTGYLDYCRVRYGGTTTWGGIYGNVEFYQSDAGNFTNSISEYSKAAGITIESCSPTITGNTINNNLAYGIYEQGGTSSAPIITNNTFNNNGDYAVYLNSVAPTAYSGNSGTGNTPNKFGWYGDVASSLTLSGSLPFAMIYPVTVSTGQTLTISSGSLLCEGYSITGAGGFTLSSGSLLETKLADGFTASADAGAIRVTGARSYGPGANYSYDGASGQATGDGLPAAVNNLTINNSSGVTLSGDLAVNGTLTLTSGDFNLNGKTTSFSAITGTNGTATIVKSLNAPSAENVGGLGALITSSQDLGSTTVKIGCAPYTVGGSSIKRSYTITPTNNTSLNATLVFPYTEGDQLNGIAEANLIMFRSTDGGTSWTNAGGTVDQGANRVTLTGINAFSQWTLGDNSNPLPVEMTSFTAIAKGSLVELAWQTATEVKNHGFEVERRAVSSEQLTVNNWEKIGFVQGNGTSNAPHEYYFTDEKVTAGKHAYRLKQIDHSGAFKYSQEIEVLIVPRAFTVSQNYPNPFNPTTTIDFTLAEDSKVRLRVFDMLGREVQTLVNRDLKAGELHSVLFDASGLSSGIYFYRLETKTSSLVKTLVLMK